MNKFYEFMESLCGVLGKVLAAFFLWLAPISNYILLALVLVVIDNITGIYESIRIRKEPITPGKLRTTIEKFVFYGLAIITAYILQKIMNNGTEIAKGVAAYIGVTEAISVYGHISKITGKNFVAALIRIIGVKFKEYVSIPAPKKSRKKCQN